MNKKISSLLVSLGAVGVVYSALNELLIYEVMDRRAKMPNKVIYALRKRIPKSLKEKTEREGAWIFKQNFESCHTNGTKGLLHAKYLASEEKSDVCVILSHSYHARPEDDFRQIAEYYHNKGFNILLIDHSGAGESEGNYISFGDHESKDILHWIEYIKDRFGFNAKIIIHGISMGAASAMMVCDKDEILPNVRLIVEDCGYASAWDEFVAMFSMAKCRYSPFLYTANLRTKLFHGVWLNDISAEKAVKNAKVPVLFVNGTKDKIVSADTCRKLFDACTSQKDILIVEGAGHCTAFRKRPEEYAEFLDKALDKFHLINN